ncbi:TrbL/VirB6 family protein [Candidatus Neoehrlichia procyonis]|uniref:TrbL/VirB6 plasmid conjugal transfer family protein n=1 Tax=Candidatus Neoehrlichia procyonis str. RAC413 TaxID=1359163 RepID=A0A0F3NMH4_9RICK|nr:type IV secretion system protein [Candidatus Neoehrlichia lotoris]KJV68981.1 trbL/VirB6 plasmid conjugal transfer family protein [Candidatus Neoehrlichia lotoris str. RAC413]
MFKITQLTGLFIMIIIIMGICQYVCANVTDSKEVIYRDTLASNPYCGGSHTFARYGQYAMLASIGSGISGKVLINAGAAISATGFGAAIGAKMIASGKALMVIGVIGINAAFASQTSYFVCNWSFVRHPVLRFEEGDLDGPPGGYKECIDPMIDGHRVSYKSECDREFRNKDEYFQCIAPGKSVEEGLKHEPMCPSKKFKKIDGYYWPKNRISSSPYIEVCYRLPIGNLRLDYLLVSDITKAVIARANGTYLREADYGSDVVKHAKLVYGGGVQCATLKAGEERLLHSIVFRAIEKDDKICVYGVKASGIPLIPQVEIGCHMRPNSPPAPMCKDSKPKFNAERKIIGYDNSMCYSCYMADVCRGKASVISKSPFPVTSVIVNCIKESLDNILTGRCATSNNVPASIVNSKVGFLKVAQDKLKKTVMAALVLALILFAIKASLGGLQSPAELYMLGIKFALVVYFTQSSAMSHYYNELVKLSIGLSDIVLQAGGNPTICNYDQSEYPKNFRYLVPWDRLDCRMMFYFGSQLNGGTGTGLILTLLLSAGMLIVAALINVKIIVCVVAFFAIMMIIFIVIWAIYVFLLSLIALTILILISPLIIPMTLFQATKGFFDGWIRQLMTYTLYPVILFAFLSLIFTVFDNLYFEDLQFERYDVKMQDLKKVSFKLKNPKACDTEENETNLACILSNMKFITQPLLFGINVNVPDIPGSTKMIWTKIGMFVLVGFLFYHFLSSISYIAAELAGDPRAGITGASANPKEMLSKAATPVKAISRMASDAQMKAFNKIGNAMRRRRMGGVSSKGEDEVSGGS